MNKWLKKRLGSHFSIKWPVCAVFYGWNAMHVAVNVRTRRWGWVCFHPTIWINGRKWPWYFYVSPNATPWAATFAVGPGIDYWNKERAPRRWRELGHNFNVDACLVELDHINGTNMAEAVSND